MSGLNDHTFQFRVSGLKLSEDTKQQISSEIASAVTRVIVAEHPDEVTGEVWSRFLVNGGRLLVEARALEVTKLVEAGAPALLETDRV